MKTILNSIQNAIQGDPVKKLQDRSSNIVNVFTQTVNDLKKVNEEINVHINEREIKIKALLGENKSLSTQMNENGKVIEKISSFFNS